MNPEKRTILPSMAFRGFASRYRRPQLSEGFQDIMELPFQVSFHEPPKTLFIIDACSLSGVRWNVKFGLDIGLESP